MTPSKRTAGRCGHGMTLNEMEALSIEYAAMKYDTVAVKLARALLLVLPTVRAAIAYGESEHTGDANCRAGDCDDCSARPALAALESAITTLRAAIKEEAGDEQ